MGGLSTRAAVLISAAILVPIVCLFLPLLNRLNHELIAFWTGLMGSLFFYHAARSVSAGADRHTRRRALRNTLLLAGLCGLISFSVSALANLLGPRCTFVFATGNFWITWVPAAALAVVLGTALGARSDKLGTILAALLLIGLLGSAYDGLQVLRGPRAVPVDLWFGPLSAFDQRATMDISGMHLAQRCMVLLLSVFLWFCSEARLLRLHPRPDIPLRPTLGAAALSGVMFWITALGAGAHVGMGWSWSRIHHALPETWSDEHFELRYAPGVLGGLDLDAITRRLHWYRTRTIAALGIDRTEPVRVFVYRDPEHMQRLTGLYSAHAQPWMVHVTPHHLTDDTLLHELVHALHPALKPGWRTNMNRGLLEGIAEAVENDLTELPAAHELQAGALAKGKLPPAHKALSWLGFRTINERIAYRTSGSFVGWLVLEHGPNKFRQAQQTFDFRGVYGKGLEELDADWRGFLRTVPVRPDEGLRASRLFDPLERPPFTDLQCAKLGSRRQGPDADAAQALSLRLYRRAAEGFVEAWRSEDKLDYALAAVGALERGELWNDALSLLDELDAAPELRPFQQAALTDARVRILTSARRWDDLYAVLDARGPAGPEADAVAACLRDPELRERTAEAMYTDVWFNSRLLLKQMREERPDFLPIVYLDLTRGLGFTRDNPARIRALMDVLRLDPTVPGLAKLLQRAVDHGFDDRDYDLVTELANSVLEVAEDPWLRHIAQRALQRIEMEEG